MVLNAGHTLESPVKILERYDLMALHNFLFECNLTDSNMD